MGDSDVDDIVTWYVQNHYVSDFFGYVSDFLHELNRGVGCSRQIGDKSSQSYFSPIKSVTNIINWSPTHLVSNTRHQHRCHHLNVSFQLF